jgi:hypothetical protein
MADRLLQSKILVRLTRFFSGLVMAHRSDKVAKAH